MRRILTAALAIGFVGTAACAQAAEVDCNVNPNAAACSAQAHKQGREAAGGAAGAAVGATVGAVAGGPIGAVVGGVLGGAFGAAAAVPHDVRTYAEQHPVNSVTIRGDMDRDHRLPESVTIYKIPNNPKYGYIYVDHRPVIIKRQNRQIVYAPAPSNETTGSISVDVPHSTIVYVEKHPVRRVHIHGDVGVGFVVPHDVELHRVPDNSKYAYVYLENGPVLVRRSNREVVWVH